MAENNQMILPDRFIIKTSVETQSPLDKSPTVIRVSVTAPESINFSMQIYELPTISAVATQLNSRTIFDNNDGFITQSQEVIYYFNRPGINQVPPIPINIKTIFNNEVFESFLYTKPISLKLPRINKEYSFVSSKVDTDVYIPNLEVNNDFDGTERNPFDEMGSTEDFNSEDKDQPIRIEKGDILKYTITLKANDAFSLFIPSIRLKPIDDVTYYYRNISNQDTSARGDFNTEIKIEVTAKYDMAGSVKHQIIPIEYYDTTIQEVRTLAINFPDLDISGLYFSKTTKTVLVILFIFIFITIYIKKRYADVINHKYLAWKKKKQLKQDYLSAIRTQDYYKLVHILYKVHALKLKEYGSCLASFYQSSGFQHTDSVHDILKNASTSLKREHTIVQRDILIELFYWKPKPRSLEKRLGLSGLNPPNY